MENTSQMSLIEIAISLMEEKKSKQNIDDLIRETLETKGLDDPDGSYKAQLYVDITTSSKFVYMGDNEWDLKERQSLDEFDKDGADFNKGLTPEEIEALVGAEEPIDEDDDDLDSDDEDYEDEEDEEDDDDDDSISHDDDEEDDVDYEDDDYSLDDSYNDSDDTFDDMDFDEDKYNEYMDDYEDQYE